MRTKFELTLTKNYANNWGVQEAIREMIQNAIDQEKQIKDNTMNISYDGSNVLSISNKSSVLSKKSLLLGYTSKADDAETIGQFGEGYKLALLVLNRIGKKVTIYNYGAKEVWTSKFVKSRKYEGEEVLTIFVEHESIWKKIPNANLTIKIEGITPSEYEEIVNRTLLLRSDIKETLTSDEYGTILLDENQKGLIYVNGLFVSSIEGLTYGYNLKPSHLKIGRDRDLVSTFDIVCTTSKMWLEHNNHLLQDLIKNGAKDIEYVPTYLWNKKNVLDSIYKSFILENGSNSIPVSSQVEFDEMKSRYNDYNIVIVNRVYKEIILNNVEFKKNMQQAVKKDLSLEEEFIHWKKRNRINMMGSSIYELENLLSKFNVINMDKVHELEEKYKIIA